ncbi:MAG: pyridoxamine 5'-phosphate oxidase family protein [Spirochaetales bacterium]|nr:pyridoxamine 5'-phosphate oxidase family protein [Spirochaetales bacterium]
MEESKLQGLLKTLLGAQLFAVLGTNGDKAPHLNIVSFAAVDDLRTILFATPRQTQKYTNLLARPGVALFVDNRSNRMRDLEEVHGVEITGTAAEVAGEAAGRYRELYLSRFPELEEFLGSPGTALVAVEVRRYDVVHRFQEVVFWEIQR